MTEEPAGLDPNEDRYPAAVHENNSLEMYGVPYHEIVGALAYGVAKYPGKYDGNLSRKQVTELHEEFLSQEHQGEKQIFESRNA